MFWYVSDVFNTALKAGGSMWASMTHKEALNMDKLLKLQDVIEMTSFSKSEIYRRLAKGTFPKPCKLGERCARWKQSDIQQWIGQQVSNG
jgi:prophage regulatory protein